jgi:hypothetical protein
VDSPPRNAQRLDDQTRNESDTAYCVRCGAEIFRWHGDILIQAQASGALPVPALQLVNVRHWCAEFRIVCASCRGLCRMKLDLPSNTYSLGPEDADVALLRGGPTPGSLRG